MFDFNTNLPTAHLKKNNTDYFSKIFNKLIDKNFEHQNNGRTNRKTLEYGYSYFRLEQGDKHYVEPIPELSALGEIVCAALGHEPVLFNNFIISLYEKDFNLEPHVDIHKKSPQNFDFYFGDRIYGVILEADSSGNFYFTHFSKIGFPPIDNPVIHQLEESPGIVFCLENELRHEPYFHGVSKIANQRLSVTFRTVHY